MLFICVRVRWGVLLASSFFFGGLNMELAYVCEWEKRPKSTHCPSIPLVCSWSCRNLVAFTTDLKNEDDDKGEHLHTVHGPWAPVGWTLPSAYLPVAYTHSDWPERFLLCFLCMCVSDVSHMIHIIDTEHPWDVYSINSGHSEVISCLEWDQSGVLKVVFNYPASFCLFPPLFIWVCVCTCAQAPGCCLRTVTVTLNAGLCRITWWIAGRASCPAPWMETPLLLWAGCTTAWSWRCM